MAELPKGYTFSLGLDEESKKELDETEIQLKKMRDLLDEIIRKLKKIKLMTEGI